MPKFVIVKFTKDDAYSFISSNWLHSGTEAYWPWCDEQNELDKLRSYHCDPAVSLCKWDLLKIKVISEKETEQGARHKLKNILEEGSDVSTTDLDKPRKRRQTKRLINEDQNSENRNRKIRKKDFTSESSSDEDEPKINRKVIPSFPFGSRPLGSSNTLSPIQSQSPMRTTSDQSQLACLREEVKKLHTELNDVKGHQLTMLSELASIREYVQNSDRRLNSLTTQKGITINIPVEIPLKSMANYDVMNNWLENQSNLDNLAKQLALTGGFDVGDTVRRISAKLLSTVLSTGFTYTGRSKTGEKKKFKDTFLCKVIFKASMLSCKCNPGIELDIEKSIINYFKYANDCVTPRPHSKKSI